MIIEIFREIKEIRLLLAEIRDLLSPAKYYHSNIPGSEDISGGSYNDF